MKSSESNKEVNMRVFKDVCDTKNLYTNFEICGYSGWDEFEDLLSILVKKMKFKIVYKLDGIWSRLCDLKKKGYKFTLMYHDEIGNVLCNRFKIMDDAYYDKLEIIANELLHRLEEHLQNEDF
jgi:hypothetical protein